LSSGGNCNGPAKQEFGLAGLAPVLRADAGRRVGTEQQGGRTPIRRTVVLYEQDRYIYNDLARRTGSIIFSASHAGEMSFESPKIQNGFFTHEVLEALGSRQADTNQDDRISVDELEAFVCLKVALMSGGLQRPTVDRDKHASTVRLSTAPLNPALGSADSRLAALRAS
jgi:hypothetical protein